MFNFKKFSLRMFIELTGVNTMSEKKNESHFPEAHLMCNLAVFGRRFNSIKTTGEFPTNARIS